MTGSRSTSKKETPEYKRVAAYFNIPDVTNARKVFLLVSDTFNDCLVSSGKRDFDEVIPNVFLGRIPCKDGFKLPENVGMVVGVVEYQEMAGLGLLKSVYKPEDWQHQNIEYVHVKMQDMTSEASPEDMLDACKKIKAFLDDPKNAGKSVYIHCKAGRSRSALLLAIYLAMYGYVPAVKQSGDPKTDFDTAYEFIKNKRPQVDVGVHKSALGYTALSMFSTKDNKNDDDVCNYTSRDEYLSSLQAKDFIRQMTSFQMMAEYATEIQYYFAQCNRTNQIRLFFEDILNSNDGSWYSRLVNHKGAIHELLEANPYTFSLSSIVKGENEYGKIDKARRCEIVENFITELNAHLISLNLSVIEPESHRSKVKLKQ